MFLPSLQAVATERASGLNWGVYSYIAIRTPPLDEQQSSYGFLFARMVGDHYEVKVDGAWTPVPYDRINSVVAPRFGGVVLLRDLQMANYALSPIASFFISTLSG
jgi:hypothetical protein